ncbi:hypothetical protein ASD28_28210 [Massilia sp. Root133]|uniref:hypothetical protein n=1 Tax=unclassified Massilia TaxID=2609279 RepID=UPI0006F5F4B8|nr:MULTISPECIES: hypothetical protein [unclassified Massilia]KQY10527.1 hypothetical protein ASD28_28210 [Massilia sp. Root133]KQZ47541.1 hypothetical protein ASD92_00665 [Massilia sp. Root1485]
MAPAFSLRRAALGAAVLSACVPCFAAAAQPLPTPAQLAALAFPGWSESAAGRVHSAALPPLPGTGHGIYAGWNVGPNRVLVEPKLVLRTDPSHLTLIAGLVPAGDDGRSSAVQATPLALAAYQFEQHGGTWGVSGRQGIFALRGFSGAAAVREVALAARRQAVAVEYGSCWQGYCGTWLAVYEVGHDAVRREPAVELALSGINVDSAADCQHRLAPLVKPHAQDPIARDDGGAPDTHDCYAIESSWSIDATHEQPGDLTIRYQGAISRAESYGGPPAAIDQKQVLRYGNGKYRAVSGYSPVPAI